MNIMKGTRNQETSVCEQQAKFIQDRVVAVETNMAELFSTFSLFSRKAARLRDANDELANVLLSYAEGEEINKSLKAGLSEVAQIFNLLGDFRDLEVRRLDKQVVEVFAQYEAVCQRVREELRDILSARDKEMSKQRQLDRLVDKKPQHRHQITKAEAELNKAKSEICRNQKVLEEQIDLFEKRKLKDTKRALLDFIKTELALHAKAVDLYTQAYNSVSEIDETQDLEELKTALSSDLSRLDTVKRNSFRTTSLQSLANLFTTSKGQQKESTGISTTVSKSSLDETQAVAEASRVISLRDEDSDQDDQVSSPYMPGTSHSHPVSFHK